MSAADAFLDTSVVLYLLSGEGEKADRVEALLDRKSAISVQVLNEFAAVAIREHALSLPEVRECLEGVRELCVTHPLTNESHVRGLEIAERYGFSLYDSMIVATALQAECRTLYSEDLQHGQVIDKRLTVINPFVSVRR
jgi:predicted nucleic acid-binding protein